MAGVMFRLISALRVPGKYLPKKRSSSTENNRLQSAARPHSRAPFFGVFSYDVDLLHFVFVELIEFLIVLVFVLDFVVFFQTDDVQAVVNNQKAALNFQGFDSGQVKSASSTASDVVFC
ncbi:MAG: hypothetical protein H6566_05620 [Lewinellaceae bacterium]|nr:hypothetical protein [Lewinellaceae bacterium]